VMKLKSLNDESQVMQRDVENLQKAYDEVLGRANKMNLESQTGQTNVSMVGSAVAPTKPSSPNLIRNLLSGLLLGGLLGVIVAFVREARDQRLRSDEEITLTMNQPLLVVLPAFGKRSNRTLPLSGNTPRPKRLTAA
jgi:polysaccharide biosynthesis transport protein